jgi:hypothetical protein
MTVTALFDSIDWLPEPPLFRVVAQLFHKPASADRRVRRRLEPQPQPDGVASVRSGGLTETQRRQIETNRQRALAIRAARLRPQQQQQQR